MGVEQVTVAARGLRTGELGSVRLSRTRGPVVFTVGGEEIEPAAIELEGASGGSSATIRGRPWLGFERVLAALAGMSVHSGVAVFVEGPELPVLDAGGLELALGLRALAAPRDRPRLRVIQAGEILAGRARYSFEPGPTVEVVAEVDGPGGTRQRAEWDGSRASFLTRVAARPLQIGGVDGVRVLLGSALPEPESQPPSLLGTRQGGREEARGALLRLLADLYCFGGPPLGRVLARRPEHAVSRHALTQGLAYGLLERLPPV